MDLPSAVGRGSMRSISSSIKRILELVRRYHDHCAVVMDGIIVLLELKSRYPVIDTPASKALFDDGRVCITLTESLSAVPLKTNNRAVSPAIPASPHPFSVPFSK